MKSSKRTPIQKILSHPTWTGIAGIATILGVIVAIIAIRSTSGTPPPIFIGKTPVSTTSRQQGTTVTTVPTTSATIAPTQNPTTTSTSTSEYSAAQPGPHCDTNGGTWTAKGLNQIQCGSGTAISSNYNSLGYLYLQLPNNAVFSSNNKISVMGGNLDYDDGYVCLGLAELGTSTGVLGEFCGNGGWFIYSLSSTGVITGTLNQSITSMRTSETISLTLQGNTVVFSIDTETYKATIPSSIQSVEVGITSMNETTNNYNTIILTNFSYIPSTS